MQAVRSRGVVGLSQYPLAVSTQVFDMKEFTEIVRRISVHFRYISEHVSENPGLVSAFGWPLRRKCLVCRAVPSAAGNSGRQVRNVDRKTVRMLGTKTVQTDHFWNVRTGK